jgi:hypothetical protein
MTACAKETYYRGKRDLLPPLGDQDDGMCVLARLIHIRSNDQVLERTHSSKRTKRTHSSKRTQRTHSSKRTNSGKRTQKTHLVREHRTHSSKRLRVVREHIKQVQKENMFYVFS